MDQSTIVAALERTLPAVRTPEVPKGWSPDGGLVWALQRYTVLFNDKAAFQILVQALEEQDDVKEFCTRSILVDLAGGLLNVPKPPEIAQHLLARVLHGASPADAVSGLAHLIETNACDALAVVSISGASLSHPLDLGADRSLVPIEALPKSHARSAAMGEDKLMGQTLTVSKAHSAFVTKVRLAPVFFARGDEGAVDCARKKIAEIAAELEEAKDCPAIIGVSTRPTMWWLQYQDPAIPFPTPNGWNIVDHAPTFSIPRTIPREAAQRLFAKYFSIPQKAREKALRVPLSRLNRAVQQSDPVDRAIDLGIALEALLLHDANPAELQYRLRLRGSLLHGQNYQQKLEVSDTLKELYSLRSKAVHHGRIPDDGKSRRTIDRGIQICADLIRTTIELDGDIDFQRLELDPDYLGNAPSPCQDQ